ncbi:MAG TPA: DUF6089 family protein [Ferruginibacter sp.]|nr:DUF6089 family protein [Ferruginibacter sp.]HMP19806.1 DUF6089 family protein [Ferruginibacter sp.]
MKISLLVVSCLVVLALPAKAQYASEAYELNGEYGVTIGAAHYFGDLNTRAKINRLKPAIGVFFRKQFNNYLGIRIAGHYAQVGYSDTYSKNDFQKARNLSFNSDIYEFSVSGDFNFFKFIPGNPNYGFTPYITLGLGIFSYNPYAYLDNQKIYLRPLGTEGQNIGYEDPITGKKRKPYGSMSVCVPLGIGLKYNVNDQFSFFVQAAQRLTFTDYLDDVSTTYIGSDKFLNNSGQLTTAGILQDRSYEKGQIIGVEGRQRGWSKQKDQYMIVEIGFSFAISSYNCPSTN